LDTIAIAGDGRAVLHDVEPGGVTMTGTIPLDTMQMNRITAGVDELGLMDLAASYIDDTYQDGTQWVLVIEQGSHKKKVYCSNYFPRQLREYAARIDAVLHLPSSPDISWGPDWSNRGAAHVKWEAVPQSAARDHENELW
jgi:hypothetical protein